MIHQKDIVLLSFPFSDLKTSKVRPVVVISNDTYNRSSEDMIVVPMTTNLKLKEYTILITQKDLEDGKLIKNSKIKVDRIFSISQKLIRLEIGKINESIYEKIKETIHQLIS